MNKTNRVRWSTATFLAVVLAAMAVPVQATGSSGSSSAQVIIDWDQIAQQNIVGGPFPQARSFAMVSIAMADAVVAVQGKYDPFFAKLRLPVPDGASAKAAAAQAAHDVLVALVPANQAALDAALATSLEGIPSGARWSGRWVGRRVAAKIVAWRLNDGFAAANPQPPAFLPSTLPGIWRQAASGPAQFSEIRNVEPFGLLYPTQFLPVPHPQLESAEYATDFNDVKDVGSATSATRTPEQTRMAQLVANAPGPYFSATGLFRLWHNIARDVSLADGMSMVDTARMFALLSASMFDSLQTSQTSKFVYRLWRPITAVADAGNDNNDATEAVSGWTPLLGTPPYPSHASNAACIGAGAAQALGNVFGSDNKSFTATWYTGDSPPSCTQVANYIYDNYLQRRYKSW